MMQTISRMNQEQYLSFLAAIVASPEDDTPRLVLADWLEEQDEPSLTARAKHIRVQIALANNGSPEVQALREREAKLQQWEGRWFLTETRLLGAEKVGYEVYSFTWERGMVNAIRISCAAWERYSEPLLAIWPIRQVQFTSMPSMRAYSVVPKPETSAGDMLRSVIKINGMIFERTFSRNDLAEESMELLTLRHLVDCLAECWPGIDFGSPERGIVFVSPPE